MFIVDLVPMRACPRCGHKNPDDFKFCERCGGQLLAQPPQKLQRVKKPIQMPQSIPPWLVWGLLMVILVAGAYWLGSQGGGSNQGSSSDGGNEAPVGTWSTYSSSAYGFSIEYPSNWVQRVDPGDAIVVFDHPSIPGVITVSSDSLGGSLASYVESYKQNLSDQQVEVVSEENIVVNGMEAYKIVEQGPTSWGTMKGVDALIKTDGQVFIVAGIIREDVYTTYESTFEHVINSFTI